jgi:hypothetical protein
VAATIASANLSAHDLVWRAATATSRSTTSVNVNVNVYNCRVIEAGDE